MVHEEEEEESLLDELLELFESFVSDFKDTEERLVKDREKAVRMSHTVHIDYIGFIATWLYLSHL